MVFGQQYFLVFYYLFFNLYCIHSLKRRKQTKNQHLKTIVGLRKNMYFCSPILDCITMNITRENIDALNAVVKVDIAKADYSDKVEKILSDYRKTANIPGFRKGHVPMGMVKKQYGKAVIAEEVNKVLQENLNKYLAEEKLDILGNPLPRMQDDINWDSDNFSFEFELGLSPKFDVELKSKKAITQYNIVADDKMLDDQVANIQKQYGKLIPQAAITKDSEITGTFTNEAEGIENQFNFSLRRSCVYVSNRSLYLCICSVKVPQHSPTI